MKKELSVLLLFLIDFISFGQRPINNEIVSIEKSSFGVLSTGDQVSLFTLSNSSGASITLTDYGARIVSIKVPDRNGVIDDVVVGYGDLSSFEKGSERFMGCVIGRYGNRIDNASFYLDGVKYNLVANEHFDGAPVQCHGGRLGFDRFVWESEMLKERNRVGVRFHRISIDGEEGFPGNCNCYVTYWWTKENVCIIEYSATTDKPTVINLSNHTYFNLKGSQGGYVMDHLLTVDADTAVQNNAHYCPDLLIPVKDSPFDFRSPHRVDYRIDMPSKQLEIMHGMSACWKINSWTGKLKKIADLYEPRCGRGVETWSTEPALLTFTGRTFNPTVVGKYGPIEKFGGMLLETIHFPDSPNQSRFPSTVLRPYNVYYSSTEWHFYSK